MSRVAKENQGLETTFLDLEKADDDSVYAAIRSDTKVRFASSSLVVFEY
jgi:cystathionine gamma-lyase